MRVSLDGPAGQRECAVVISAAKGLNNRRRCAVNGFLPQNSVKHRDD